MTQCFPNCHLIFIQHFWPSCCNICVGRVSLVTWLVGFFNHIPYGFVYLVSTIFWLGLLLFWVLLSYFGLFQTLVLDIFLINVNLSAIFTASAWDKLMMVQTAGKMKSICDRWLVQFLIWKFKLFIFSWRFQKLNWWSVSLFLRNYILFYSNIVSLWILKYLLQLK